MILWFTGQPGSGKTTLCNEVIKRVSEKVIHIDGDDIREVLDNKDYSENGRRKNIKFAINMAKVMESKGYLVVVSLVSPYRDLRIGEIKSNISAFESRVNSKFFFRSILLKPSLKIVDGKY